VGSFQPVPATRKLSFHVPSTSSKFPSKVNSFLSAVQAVVEDILSKRHDLSQEEVLSLIEQKKTEGRGLLSDEGAARLVAEELLIRTRGKELGRMHVKDLVSGLNDVSISGRVLLAWPPQRFQRRDGTPGRVMSLVIVDRTGRVRCALWDKHADTASKSGNLQGKIVRIGHAYTRQGLSGDVEINAGDRSSIEFDPPDIPTSDFPKFDELFIKIGGISGEMNQVNTIGVVQLEPRFYSFTKEEREGSVLRTAIADESASVSVVAWNDRAQELRNIKKGDILQIVNARTKLDNNSKLELHVEARSQAEILQSTPDYLKMPVPRTNKITDLSAQMEGVDLSLSVLAKSATREVKRSATENVKVSSLLIADETGIASLSLWDDKAELVNQITEGDSLRVKGVSVRERYGELRLGLGKSGLLEKSDIEMEIPSVTKLNALESAKGLLIVEGVLSDEPLIRQVVTGKGETVDVASFTLRDEAGSSKITVWRDQVKLATKLHAGTHLRLTGVRARLGLTGQIELGSIPLTKIETIEKAATERPAWEDIRQVIALEPGLTTWIKGLVLDIIDGPKLKASCETCGAKLTVSSGNFVCDHCKSNKTGNITMTGKLKMDDGTGVTQVILVDQNPRQFTPIDTEEFRERMLKEGETTLQLERDALSKVIGNEVEAYGTVEAGNGQGKLVFKAKRIVSLGTK
jgi:replication factor A1